MTTVAASSSSSSSFPMPHREASLPPLRYLFGQQAPAPTSRRSERTGEEEDEALPLLVSMYAQRREAEPKQQLPTISSMLSGGRCPSPTSSRPMMTPPPEARASSSSPVPQPSPSSPSSLSPGLFVLTMSSSSSSSASSSPSKSFSSTSSSTGSSPSSSPLSFSSPSSPSSSAEGAVANHAYASATNSLMELSDIISSMPALQNLPVPSAPLNDSPSSPASLGGDADGNDNDDDPDYRATSPVSSRTRRVTRRSRMQQQKQQQLQIERIRSELEQERDRARDLQRELQLALQERAELLQLKGDVPPAAMQAVDNSINAAAGLSFLNVLNEQTEGGSHQLVFAHLPRANSLPSFFSGFADADASDLQHVSSSSSSELGLRSRSAPMLPPIGSVPALSPYLKRKRASLPAGADYGARHSLSPASSPLRPSTRVSFSCGDSARPSRRRRLAGYGEEEDEDYEPTASANSKKIKRSRSISEGGRRLTQASSNAREGRRRSHQQFGDYAAGYDHAEAAAAFIASRRARAIENQSSRASMDVVEGADQEDDDGSAATTTTTTTTATAPEFQRRDSVLCFIKDHPHASFWLSRGKARN